MAIDAAQLQWLRVPEVLRRLDAGLELARRPLEEQIPKNLACNVVLAVSEWFLIAFTQFLSAEAGAILGIKEIGELKVYMVERFKGILDLTVKNADKTHSPIPDRAKERIAQAWNVKD